MPKKTKRHTDEFKEEAIKFALSSVSVSHAAKSLGIPDATLHTWVTQAKKSGQQAISNKEGVMHISLSASVLNIILGRILSLCCTRESV
jgi:transposase-like protein